jgi:predicted nuclease of restriction endonuclease-like RecB superfamily
MLLLVTRAEGDRIVPRYLTERDHRWLRALLEEHTRFEGHKRSELAARLLEPLLPPAPRIKLRVATSVLDTLASGPATSAIPAQEARWRLFTAAAEEPARSRKSVLEVVAAAANVTPAELDAALFADLRGERLVPALPPALTAPALATRANLLIAASLLRRAASVRITASGNVRALVRHARILGLICNVQATKGPALKLAVNGRAPREDAISAAVLDVSGPLALFHHTEVYGRALASLVPRVACCDDFELVAECALGKGRELSTFTLRSDDPIPASHEFTNHERRVEERFVRDFQRAAPEWTLVHEPDPVDADGSLLFADFELVHRHDPKRRFLLEIVGFWTAEYLRDKLARLRAAGTASPILCVDARRRCRDDELPAGAPVVWYKSKIDARAVLALIDAQTVRSP